MPFAKVFRMGSAPISAGSAPPHRSRRCAALLLTVLINGYCFASENTVEIDGAPAGAESPAVEFRDGRLSVTAKRVSNVELIRLVGAEAGFEVRAYGDPEERTGSWSFRDLPLSAGVAKLLRGTSAIVSYGPGGSGGADASITRIFLLGSGSAEANSINVNLVSPDLANQARLDSVEAESTQDRIAAIDRTEGLADEITLENLAFSLRHDPQAEVRMQAVLALESIGGPAAATALEAGLGDQQPEVRIRVIEALGKIDDERIPLWLGQILTGDAQDEVRRAAVRTIAGKHGDVARIFLEAAAGDSSEIVREAALELLR